MSKGAPATGSHEVLVVDDAAQVRALPAEALEREAFAVEAADGEVDALVSTRRA